MRPYVSLSLFVQFSALSVVLAFSLIHLLFFANFLTSLFSIWYLPTCMMQSFPICFTCDLIIEDCNDLAMSIFHSNWIGEEKRYKMAIIIFMQNVQKPIKFIGAGILPICLATYSKVISDIFFISLDSLISFLDGQNGVLLDNIYQADGYIQRSTINHFKMYRTYRKIKYNDNFDFCLCLMDSYFEIWSLLLKYINFPNFHGLFYKTLKICFYLCTEKCTILLLYAGTLYNFRYVCKDLYHKKIPPKNVRAPRNSLCSPAHQLLLPNLLLLPFLLVLVPSNFSLSLSLSAREMEVAKDK